uniref:Nodulin-like domain-containing protein n=1 Tax=Kalanchoe fedtschenkoi TaxID=63787 RepID=A0A7N0T209_KALFE
MVGQSRKWTILVATIWIQAFTGTNFDFSSYSSDLKSVLGISQLQLNYLSVASDMGKAFGWCSGVALLYVPMSVVMFMAALMGLVGYGLQWAVILKLISVPYILVFCMCLLAGCSISWFNTVCYMLCIRNFPTNRSLALSLTISFNGVSAALYTLIANAINPDSNSIYLCLNGFVPLLVSCLVLVPILRQPPSQKNLPAETVKRDAFIFLVLNVVAVVTGLYLLLLNSIVSNAVVARVLLVGAIFLLVVPLCMPGIVCARDWASRTILPSINFQFLDSASFTLVDIEDLELRKRLVSPTSELVEISSNGASGDLKVSCKETFEKVLIEKNRLLVLGEEHSASLLIQRWDFWLYYVAYFCSGTLGIVYSNNLGQISQSLGFSSRTSSMVTLYSTCSFFGRLLSAAPDILRDKVHFARTGWLTAAIVVTPFAFFLLAASGSETALSATTALIGLSSGFIFSAAVSITSELFGPNSAGVNHNILITNIPLGSILYGLQAALVYDSQAAGGSVNIFSLGEALVCMGRQCYFQTLIWWGCISILGLVSCFFLFLRTKPAYEQLDRKQFRTESYEAMSTT